MDIRIFQGGDDGRGYRNVYNITRGSFLKEGDLREYRTWKMSRKEGKPERRAKGTLNIRIPGQYSYKEDTCSLYPAGSRVPCVPCPLRMGWGVVQRRRQNTIYRTKQMAPRATGI